jgi:UDPglucose 6-dehydrogenase
MKVTVFGTGYVGLVTGACFAEVGNDVLCVDIDSAKVARLNAGQVPIFEPGLEEMVAQNVVARRIRFSDQLGEGVGHAQLLVVAVGTPPNADGSTNLSAIRSVLRSIADAMTDDKIIVIKSTVPVGTGDMASTLIGQRLAERGISASYDVVSNPEFLKEGAAIADFMRPDRIIVGSANPRSLDLLHELYAPFNRNHNRLMTMDLRSAELTKYAANAMLATKISFMNEVANIAERVGANVESVRAGIGSDPRIGYDFIYAGAGFGGSCFPKDLGALEHVALEAGYEPQLIRAVQDVNQRQKRVLFEKIARYFHGQGGLAGRTIAIWGLAFKPNTDDMREAPSRVLLDALLQAGAQVRAFDPEAMAEARQLYPDTEALTLTETKEAATEGADCLVIVTEWRAFRSPDFTTLRATLTKPVVFDGRNVYDERRMTNEGFAYYGIGTGDRLPVVVSDATVQTAASRAD